MTTRSQFGPFRPGAGGLPPYLAGRAPEQTLCRALLGDLRNGVAPSRDLVLYGPRGNGKTVLLVWLQQEAEAAGGVDVLALTPPEIPTVEKLVERLVAPSWWRRVMPGQVSMHGITWRSGKDGPPPLDKALEVRARRKPLLLSVDEAHTLDVDVGRALLNASQQVGRSLPFLLVLAGTPNLRDHLDTMNATFWNRANIRPIGRLDAEATRTAVRNPLRSDDIDIDDDALSDIVYNSHGYPYFVQLWGQAMWQAVSRRTAAADRPETAGRRRITRAMVKDAQAALDREKDLYYLNRYEELEKLRLLPEARAVAEAFGAQPRLDDAQLETAIRRGLGAGPGADRVTAAKETLRKLGYVWRPEAQPDWEPGIPSLMDYVRKYAPATRAS